MATIDSALRERLAAKGVRATPQRLLVLEVLAGERNDATAQAIHRRLHERGETVGLATVYRTLAVLAEHGVVDVLDHRRGESCYRLCGDEHHHHLVCSGCHRVVELEECELDSWIEDLATARGWVAREHRLEVSGLCAECR
jgi:Fur family ferric uptake transcriptional regulator